MKIVKDQYFIQDSVLQIMKTKDPQHFMLFKIFNNQKSDKQ